MEVPRSLRSWFVVHGALGVAAALPLLVAPGLILRRLGWTAVDPVTARLVGAALLAIGAASTSARDAGIDVTRALLRLNLVWSLAAACALFAGIGAGAPPAAWAFLSIFIAFAGVWLHHAIRFRQLERAATLDDSPENDDSEHAPPDSASD
jgi:hypothetical protein